MAQTGIFEALQQVQAENALLKSQGLDPTGFGSLIEAGSLENLFGGDQQVPAPQQDLQQILTDQFDPRSVDPVGISGRASGQTGAESLRFGTPPPDLAPVPVPRSKQSQEQVTRSLARLQTLDPSGVSAKFALTLIENRNAQELTATKVKMDEVFKETTNLLRVKDPVAQERQIIQTIRDRASRGIPSPALQKILELPLERRVVGLEQRKTIATDVKIISENEQKELDRESRERIATQKLRVVKPTTEIGKAQADLNAGLISQVDFDKIKNAPPEFQSTVGKLIGDRNAALNLFGKDSPQIKAFDEAIKAESKGEVKLPDVKGVRGDFIKLSGDFVKLGDNFKKINAARSTPAGDVSLIFNFMKMLDPTSVVREGEQATAAAAGPLIDRVTLGAYNKAVLGTKLLPKQRADFKAEAQNIFASQMGAQLRREREFTGIAKRAGMNPKDVVLDFIGPFRKVGGKKELNVSEMSDEDLLKGF